MPRSRHSSSDAVSLAWSPDGTRIAAAPQPRRCPGLGGHLRETDPPPQDPGVEAVGWGPGGNLVASTTGRAIRFWDTETWECSAKVPLTGSRTAPM